MTDWQPISTAPIDRKIDVWVWELGEGGMLDEGMRFPEVKFVGRVPQILEICNDADEGWYPFPLHENGMVATHWMPLPAPPQPHDTTDTTTSAA